MEKYINIGMNLKEFSDLHMVLCEVLEHRFHDDATSNQIFDILFSGDTEDETDEYSADINMLYLRIKAIWSEIFDYLESQQ